MKTRIVNPSIWENDKIAELSKDSRIAINFLINNPKLGLSPYSFITDKYATYCTGLNNSEWEKAKQELQNLGWCYFYNGWVFQNHNFAYIDYFGRDRVMKSKQDELNKIPLDVTEYFKGLISGNKEVSNLSINHKSKTINLKPINNKDYMESITPEVISEISNKYLVPESFVKSKLEDIELWEGEKPGRMKGRNWKLTLMNWVKRDSLKIKQEYAKDTSDIAL